MRPADIHVATEISGRVVTACFRMARGAMLELVELTAKDPSKPAPTSRAFRCALPPGAAWYRTLPVPAGDARGRRKIVAFEAGRVFPAAGRDLVWDSCRAPGAKTEEGELVVGIRFDDVVARIARLRAVGVRPVTLEPSGGPLYRYFRYMEPKEFRPGVLVDLLGAAAQVILVADGRWTLRTISDASSTAGPSRLERIHLEIARLVASLGTASSLAWVRVCADPASAESLRRDLEQRLALPVGLLDPGAAGRVGGARLPSSAEALAGAFPVLVGLALAPMAGEPVLNLLPPSIRQQQTRLRRQPALIAVSALVALSFGALAMRAGQRTNEANLRADRLRQELPPLREHRRQLDLNQARVRVLDERIARAGQLFQERDVWIRFLEDLQTAVDAAGEAWIDRLERETKVEGADALEVVVHGRLLDPDAPGARVSEAARRRVTVLLASLGAASTVTRIRRERFTPGDPGVLQFELGVVLALGESESHLP